VALTTFPIAPLSLDPTSFSARVVDSAGKPVSGAQVNLSLAMPTMDMGENKVTLHEDAASIYAGTGRFTMSGTWRVTVTAIKSKVRATQEFFFQVK